MEKKEIKQMMDKRRKLTAADRRLKFGRYKGQLVETVAREDVDYAKWLVRESVFKQLYKPFFFNRLDKFILSEEFYSLVGMKKGELKGIERDLKRRVKANRIERETERYGATVEEIKKKARLFVGSISGVEYIMEAFWECNSNEWHAGDTYAVFKKPNGAYMRVKRTETVKWAFLKKGGLYELKTGVEGAVVFISGRGVVVERFGAKITVNGEWVNKR